MIKRLVLTAFVLSAIAMLAIPGLTSLVPMSWGFPTLVQNSSLTNLASAFSNSTDFETSDISFPTTSSGVLGTSFPTISQIAQKGSDMSQFQMMSQNQYSQFAYPWLSIGYSPVPSMGLL